MALRGELVVECDVPTCQAELVIPAENLIGDVIYLIEGHGWSLGWESLRVNFICPQCLEEGRAE